MQFRSYVILLFALVFSQAAVQADRSLNRTLSDQLGQRASFAFEYTYFDDSLDVLNYQSKLGGGAKPDQASIGSLEIQVPFQDRWQFIYAYQNIQGRAVRSSEPRTLTTTVKSHLIEAGFGGWSFAGWTGRVFAAAEQGNQDSLSVDCYARGALVLGGSCDNATVRFFDPDIYRDTGETVYLPVLTSNAEQRSFSIAVNAGKVNKDWQWVHHLQLRQSKVEIGFDSPLFKITDPFTLGITFQGQTVDRIITNLKNELPQATPWQERTLTYEFTAMRQLGSRWIALSKVRALKIWRNNYQPSSLGNDTTNNLALDMSLWYSPTSTLSAYLRAEVFQHYVAGFQPLAYNRRTARLFEHPYGQVSIGIVFATP